MAVFYDLQFLSTAPKSGNCKTMHNYPIFLYIWWVYAQQNSRFSRKSQQLVPVFAKLKAVHWNVAFLWTAFLYKEKRQAIWLGITNNSKCFSLENEVLFWYLQGGGIINGFILQIKIKRKGIDKILRRLHNNYADYSEYFST